MKPTRHQIAAGVTVVALGALATVALASGSTPATDTAAAPQSAPEVRTEIVRETVHRRAKASSSPSSGSRAVRSSSSPSAGRSTAAVAPVAGPSHQRRGRGTDDVGLQSRLRRRAQATTTAVTTTPATTAAAVATTTGPTTTAGAAGGGPR